ncbi:unnamed protein product [Arabidopsis thaliana]|uniref:Uncharacterized protein n=1 Tax=Arabidopsis thaliana TaxID=3702 RepID=A0A5S9YA01_ARATH|nr:unnamed protein product [Arabidopsis thaliana]
MTSSNANISSKVALPIPCSSKDITDIMEVSSSPDRILRPKLQVLYFFFYPF